MARLGEIIEGKYEVLREIGRGGMSVVYLAMDVRLNKQWAIKEVRRNGSDENSRVTVQSLIAEANLIKKLDHPALPRIVDIIENKDTIFVVMDYIEGEPMDKVLATYGAQPQEAVIEWGKQLCDVLDYLHTRKPPIIYRDMKPGNIMLRPDGTIKVFDFGIAREFKEGRAEDTVCLGTKGYAAPEQFGGRGQTDARTDVYCLGVTLYHLVTGQNPCEPPYELYPIRHWNPTLSSGLEWLIQKCTQMNPEDRFQSCAEVRYVLDNLEKFDGAYRAKQKSKVRMFIASTVATAICLVIGTGGLLLRKAEINKNYNIHMTNGNYTAALEIDATRPEPYIGILSGMDGISEENLATINLYFTETNLSALKENYPHEYSQICYELGLIFVSNSGAADEEDNINECFREARPYFQNVIEQEDSGLNEKNIRIAKAYFNLGKLASNDMKDDDSTLGEGSAATYADRWGYIEEIMDALEPSQLESGGISISRKTLLRTYMFVAYQMQADTRGYLLGGDVSYERFVAVCDEIEDRINMISVDDFEKEAAWKDKTADYLQLARNNAKAVS